MVEPYPYPYPYPEPYHEPLTPTPTPNPNPNPNPNSGPNSDQVVPDEFNAIIATTLKEIDQIGTRIDSNLYKAMTVFVDPIDGTREFATAQVRPLPCSAPLCLVSLRLALAS